MNEPEKYFRELVKDKCNGVPEVAGIPVDVSIAWHGHNLKRPKDQRCVYCGTPHLETAIHTSECKKCEIRRLTGLYGPEQANEIYEELYARLHGVKPKAVDGVTEVIETAVEIEDDDDLPF